MRTNQLTPGHNLRWKSSRMMLPEHVEALQMHATEREKDTKPLLDEQALEEIDRVICEAIDHTLLIQVHYDQDGVIKSLLGLIKRYDQMNHILYMQDKQGYLHKIRLNAILNVDLSDE